MTDDDDSAREGAQTGESSAGEQTSRLRAELGARREAAEIVAEANRISEQAAAEAAIGLGLVIAMFRNAQTVNVDDVHLLEG